MPRLHVHPDLADDPYPAMVNLAARAEGWTISASATLNRLLDALARLGSGDIVHLYSLTALTGDRQSETAARRGLATFRTAAQAAIARGVRLIWTVGDPGPSDARYPEVEAEAATFLAARSWRVIQRYPEVGQVVTQLQSVPAERLVTLREPSYRGIYPPAPSVAEARAALGVAADGAVAGFACQPASGTGFHTLLAAAGRVAGRVGGLTLVVAEPVDTGAPARPLVRSDATGTGFSVVRTSLPRPELGTVFTAADLMVFPCTGMLDAAPLLLSAGYGRPCIVPDEPHLRAAYDDQQWVRFFDPVDEASLAEAIVGMLGAVDQARAPALAFAAQYTLLDLTGQYLRILTETGSVG